MFNKAFVRVLNMFLAVVRPFFCAINLTEYSLEPD